MEGLRANLRRLQVVALLEVDRVDLFGLDEITYVDGLGDLRRGLVDLIWVDDDNLAVVALHAASDVVPLDFFVLGAAKALLDDARAVGLVDEVEGNVAFLGSAVELDRDGDHAEVDRAGPDRSHAPQYWRRRYQARGNARGLGCSTLPKP